MAEKFIHIVTAAAGRHERDAIVRELGLFEKNLKSAKSKERPAVMRNLAAKTKWGTPERAAAYYVCAWYGVDYKRCRDYMINAHNWGDLRKPSDNFYPFCWQEYAADVLYRLYEHNHDFRLLHDVMTWPSDGAASTVRDRVVKDAFERHPRGVLHVAKISLKGLDLAIMVVSGRYGSEGETFTAPTFCAYVGRVAAHSKDPLATTAQELRKSIASDSSKAN